VVNTGFRILSASVFGLSVLILLAGMVILPENSSVQEQLTLQAGPLNVLTVLVSIAAPVCVLSAAGWVVAVILDARQQARSDSILDWRLE
jgi:hypothetical protein